ncbi:hypothetical protein MJ585_27740 [Klebsiella pneumoniae]|nr:hypothetical protein MJ585_27740 [Klebsiella pneumoniae]
MVTSPTWGRPSEAIDAVAAELGNAQQKLQQVQMLPVFIGIDSGYCWDLSRCLFPASLPH